MAPVTSASTNSKQVANETLLLKEKCLAQSKIPVKTSVDAKLKSALKEKNVVPAQNILRSKRLPLGKSADGKTIILKPAIKKNISSLSKDMSWTKPSPHFSSRRKSIEKAKSIRVKKILQQRTVPKLFEKIDEVSDDSKTIDDQKENKLPSIIVHSPDDVTAKKFQPANSSEKNIDDEFVSSEYYRNQILSNKPLTFAQLKTLSSSPKRVSTSTVSKKLERLKKSPAFAKFEKSVSKHVNQKGQSELAKKLERLTLSPTLRRPTISPKSSSSAKCNPFSDKSWQKSYQRCSWHPVLNSSKKTLDKNEDNKNLSDKRCNFVKNFSKSDTKPQHNFRMAPRFTWTPQVLLNENKHVHSLDKNVKGLKCLAESYMAPKPNKPKACVALFQSEKKNNESNSENTRRTSTLTPLSESQKTLIKLRERRSKLLANPKIFQSWELDLYSVKKKENVKSDDECTMDQIRQLKRKIPTESIHSSKKASPSSKFGLPKKIDQINGNSNKKLSITKNMESLDHPEVELSKNIKNVPSLTPFKKINDLEMQLKPDECNTPNKMTPHRVRFDLSDTPSVYRPLRVFIAKSILKKQPRLTDIVEAIENESLRDSSELTIHKMSFDDQNNNSEAILNQSNLDASSLSDNLSLCVPKVISPVKSLEWSSSSNVALNGNISSTSIHKIPICTPLVLKNLARNSESKELIKPIKQTSFDELLYSKHLNCNGIISKGNLENILADEEVADILVYPIVGNYSRHLFNPIAKILNEGDEQHFIPICSENLH